MVARVQEGGSAMGRVRALSSPPKGSAAERAARAAQAAADSAAHAASAAVAAAEAAARGGEPDTDRPESSTPSPELSTLREEWPPPGDARGLRWFYARSHPSLQDGIYTTVALQARGVDPEVAAASGLLFGWKTETPALRRACGTGVDHSIIYWR